MKKNLIVLALIIAVCFASGCLKGTEKKVNQAENTKVTHTNKKAKEKKAQPKELDYEKEYAGILSETYDYILNCSSYERVEGKEGIWEAADALKGDAVNKIYYTFKDINDDGIKELIIGNFEENVYSKYKNSIYALYTLYEGKPRFVAEGRSRSTYSLTKDNKLFYNGSNGAAYNMFGTYSLSEKGELICKDYYFTYPTDDNTKVELFNNTTGKDDKGNSKKLNISDEDFWKICDDFKNSTVLLEGTTFNNLPQSIKGDIVKKQVFPDVSLMEGTWELVSGNVQGDANIVEEAGLTSEIYIENQSGTLYADYWLMSSVQYQSFTGEARYLNRALYEGSYNTEWCVEFTMDSGNFTGDNKFFATLIHEDTLVVQRLFNANGENGVGYYNYRRK